MTEQDPSLRLNYLRNELFDPESRLYVENLLDVATAVSYDVNCSGQLKDSKALKTFNGRYQNLSDIIKEYRLSLNDFKVIKTVGQGGFGRVDLVKHKISNNVFAMKVINKSTYVQNNFNGFWEERDILVKNDSEWLVKCYYSFFDLKNLYIVMEYMPGGDLLRWLNELEEFNEEQTHFFGMEMVLALEYLHGMDYIHRDLKPENMLLDKRGHLKLADFGTCIKSTNGRVKTNFQCGTPDYIAPEVLNKSGTGDLEVGSEIDWWAIGILIYEMFYGETPWDGETASVVYCNIMNYKKTLIYPDDKEASPEYLSLLNGILTDKSTRMSVDQIKSHAFFKTSKYKWTFSNISDYRVPIESFNVKGDDDTSYIEYEPNQRDNNFNFSTKNNYFTGDNLAFAGFTFNRDHTYVNNSASGLGELENKCHKLVEKLEEKDDQLKSSNKKLADISRNINEKEQLIFEQTDELEMTKDKLLSIQSKNSILDSHIEQLNNDKMKLETTLTTKESKLKDYLDKNSEYEQLIESYKASAHKNEEEIEKIKADLIIKEDKLIQLENTNEHLTKARHNEELLRKELSEQKRLLTESEFKKDMLTSLVEELRTNRVQNTNEELLNLRTKYDEILNEKQNIESKKQSLEKGLDEIQNEKSKLKKLYDEELSKNNGLIVQKDRLSQEINELKLVVKELRGRLSVSEDKNRILTQQMKSTERDLNKFENDKKIWDNMKGIYSEQLKQNEDQINELTANSKQEIKVLNNKLDDRNNKLKETEKEVQEYMSEIKSMKNKLTKSVNEREKMEQNKNVKIEQLEQQMQIMKTSHEERVDNLKKENDKLTLDVKHNKDLISSLVDKTYRMIQDEVKSIVNQKPATRKLKRQYQADSEAARKMKQLEVELASMKRRLNETQEELVQNKNNNHDLLTQLKASENEVAHKNKIIETLHKQLDNQSTNSTVNQLNMSDMAPQVDLFESSTIVLHLMEMKRKKPFYTQLTAKLLPNELILMNKSVIKRILEIKLMAIIKESSAADFRNAKIEPEKIIMIAYSKSSDDELDQTNGQNSTLVPDMNMANLDPNFTDQRKRSTIDSTWRNSTSDLSSVNDSFTMMKGHKFLTVHLRRSAVCDVCQLPCSDFINPPPVYECVNCKIRVHPEHINGTTSKGPKLHPCDQNHEWIYLKFDNVEIKSIWFTMLKKLKARCTTNTGAAGDSRISTFDAYSSVRVNPNSHN